MSKTILIYALGGGWGHLNRSLALARIAARSYKIKLITNSPYLSQIDIKNHEIFTISPKASFQQVKDFLQQIVQQDFFDCLIVDTFPRGLGGELAALLPNITQPKILVNRYLNTEYIKSYRLKEFVSQNYDLVLIPGENIPSDFANLPQTSKTNPWLIRSQPELANLSTTVNLLRLNFQQVPKPLIIILASGYQIELNQYGEIAATLNRLGYVVRCLSANLPATCPAEIGLFHYPALECLWLADVVVGSGGYNTVYECAQLNLPLIAIPHKRLYDCQETRISVQQRLGKCRLARNQNEVINLIQQLPFNTKFKQFRPQSFQNGAEEALSEIECYLA